MKTPPRRTERKATRGFHSRRFGKIRPRGALSDTTQPPRCGFLIACKKDGDLPMKPLLRFTADTALALIMGTPCFGQHYMPVNLVSNTAGVARVTDPQLINPWGMSRSPSSAWWVSDQRTGFSTVYNGAGAKQSLIVAIPQADPNQRRCQGNVKTPVKCDTFPGDKQVAHRSYSDLVSGTMAHLSTV